MSNIPRHLAIGFQTGIIPELTDAGLVITKPLTCKHPTAPNAQGWISLTPEAETYTLELNKEHPYIAQLFEEWEQEWLSM